MKRKPYLSVGDAIKAFLKRQGLDDKARIQEMILRWEELLGKPVATNTERIWFEEGTLYVKVNSPVWKHELGLARNSILKTVNKHMKKPLIKEVKIL